MSPGGARRGSGAICRPASRGPVTQHLEGCGKSLPRTRRGVPPYCPGARRLKVLPCANPADRGGRAEHRCDVLLNATDPRFVLPLFKAAGTHGAHYLDMAMSLSRPHGDRRYEECGVELVDAQFEQAAQREKDGLPALAGLGAEPGLSDVFAHYAADELFDEIEEIGVRDGADLVVSGYDFAPSFSIWTTIEECLNSPVVYEDGRGRYTTPPVSEPEGFDCPEGIGKGRRVTAGRRCGAPARPGRTGRPYARQTCAGICVKGTKGGRPREVYRYHVVDDQWSMQEHGSQAVVCQAAINPVVALELVASGLGGERCSRLRDHAAQAIPRAAGGVRLPMGSAGEVTQHARSHRPGAVRPGITSSPGLPVHRLHRRPLFTGCSRWRLSRCRDRSSACSAADCWRSSCTARCRGSPTGPCASSRANPHPWG